MATKQSGPGPSPIVKRSATLKKSTLQNKAGKTVYASPVKSGIGTPCAPLVLSRRVVSPTISGVMSSPKNREPRPLVMQADNTRVARERLHPFDLQRAILGPILESRKVGVAIINQTKTKIDLADLESTVAAVPDLNIRLGSVKLGYKYRIAKNWKDFDPDKGTAKGPGKEWLENTNINAAEIVMVVSEEDRPTIRATGTPRPQPTIKVEVYIPPILINSILNGSFRFLSAENIDKYYNRAGSPLSGAKSEDVTQARLDKADSLYNKNKDKLGYGINVWKNAGMTPGKAAWNTAKAIRPFIKVDPGRLQKQFNWIGGQLTRYSDDYKLVSLNSASSAAKAINTVGRVGTVLSATIIGYKVYKDTWSMATVADGAVLLAGAVAAVYGAIVVGSAIATGITVACAAYGLTELVSGGAISDYWEAMFPRNKPFSPPAFSYYVDR